jgi:hypothetical protein
MHRKIEKHRWHTFILLVSTLSLPLTFFATSSASAQQPFYTDDADVTPKKHFHFEVSNELDWLQRADFPSLRQNTLDFEVDYGLANRLEVGVEVPVLSLAIARDAFPRGATGIGDTNISAKYNFLSEREKSRLPAMTIVVNLELPTGSVKRQLGSGLADFFVNGVLQKSLTKETTLRLNGGVLFSGNETTGLLGIKARGTVLTAGASLVKKFNSKLQLGVEVTGATSKNLLLSKGQLQGQIGGNYQFRRNASFDFGVIAGKYVASPRVGVQIGLSIDF